MFDFSPAMVATRRHGKNSRTDSPRFPHCPMEPDGSPEMDCCGLSGSGIVGGEEQVMASIFKPTYIRKNPKTGKKVRRKLKKWYIEYRDGQGVIRRVPGLQDKESTKLLARELERKAMLEAQGIEDKFEEHRNRLLLEHLDDFKQFLESKGRGRKYYQYTYGVVKRALEGCKFRLWRDLSPSRFVTYLGDIRDKGRVASTHNSHLTAMKGFLAWMVRDRRAPENPLAHIQKIPTEDDRAFIRRALTQKEFGALLQKASPHRATIYVFAAYTGLRAEEIGTITRDRFMFGPEPTFRAGGLCRKRHQMDVLPLHPAVVERIEPWAKKLLPKALLWPGNWYKRASEMLQEDLGAAEIPYVDESGMRFDFHALRGQFGTSLARAGVSIQEAQALMRHSDPKLTANVYTHLSIQDHRKSIEKLPSPVQHAGSMQEQASLSGNTCDPIVSHGTRSGGAVKCRKTKRGKLKSVIGGGLKRSTPARTRTWDPLIKNQLHQNSNRVKSQPLTPPPTACIQCSTQEQPEIDPALARLIAAWPSLDEETQRQILQFLPGLTTRSCRDPPGSRPLHE